MYIDVMVEPLSFDAVLDLCRNRHRRIVLAILAEEQQPMTVNDLAETILTYDDRASVTEASEEAITEIECSLQHRHLPKLASAGVIDYDTEWQLVEPVDEFDQKVSYLPAVLDTDPDLERPVKV